MTRTNVYKIMRGIEKLGMDLLQHKQQESIYTYKLVVEKFNIKVEKVPMACTEAMEFLATGYCR